MSSNQIDFARLLNEASARVDMMDLVDHSHGVATPQAMGVDEVVRTSLAAIKCGVDGKIDVEPIMDAYVMLSRLIGER